MRSQFLAVAISATLALASPAALAIRRRDADAAIAPNSFGALQSLFAIVEAIPVSTLEAGDAAVSEYLATAPASIAIPATVVEARSDSVETRAVAAQANVIDDLKCAAEIAKVILTTVVPAARLLRIKKYIEALGGTGKIVKILIKIRKGEKVGSAEILSAGKKLLGEITGITGIKEKCDGVLW